MAKKESSSSIVPEAFQEKVMALVKECTNKEMADYMSDAASQLMSDYYKKEFSDDDEPKD